MLLISVRIIVSMTYKFISLTFFRKKTGRNTDWDSNVSVRKDRAHQYCMLVHYEAKAPEKCSPKAQEMYNKMYETVKEAAEKVKQVFV